MPSSSFQNDPSAKVKRIEPNNVKIGKKGEKARVPVLNFSFEEKSLKKFDIFHEFKKIGPINRCFIKSKETSGGQKKGFIKYRKLKDCIVVVKLGSILVHGFKVKVDPSSLKEHLSREEWDFHMNSGSRNSCSSIEQRGQQSFSEISNDKFFAKKLDESPILESESSSLLIRSPIGRFGPKTNTFGKEVGQVDRKGYPNSPFTGCSQARKVLQKRNIIIPSNLKFWSDSESFLSKRLVMVIEMRHHNADEVQFNSGSSKGRQF